MVKNIKKISALALFSVPHIEKEILQENKGNGGLEKIVQLVPFWALELILAWKEAELDCLQKVAFSDFHNSGKNKLM